jgi:uncharacterized protein (TIGR03032 family)
MSNAILNSLDHRSGSSKAGVGTQTAPTPAQDDPSTVTMHDDTGVFISILSRIGCSIALSTDDSRLIVIGADNLMPSLAVVVLPFLRGLAARGQFIAAGTADSVVIFKSIAAIASVAPYAPQTFDAIYSPRAIHFTGRCDFHDMAFINGVVTAVNTRYSCICTVDGRYNFTPIWKPPFITQLLPEDRCHLNGMAVEGNRIRYVTMLGRSDAQNGWRDTFLDDGGVVMDATDGRVVASGLSLPHSPRVVDGKLYCLDSGRGQMLQIDPQTGDKEIIATLPGFAHGLAEYGGVLFVGFSKLRRRRPEKPLPIEAEGRDLACGIAAVDPRTRTILGMLEMRAGVHEIFDLQLIPNVRRADIRSVDQWKEHHAIELPQGAFWATEPEPFR